jgi:hypothetical protein
MVDMDPLENDPFFRLLADSDRNACARFWAVIVAASMH